MKKPFKSDTIEEKLENIIKTQTKENMSTNTSHYQGKPDSNKNNSLNETVNSEPAKAKKYLVIDSDNKPEIKSINEFDAKMQAVLELYVDNKKLLKKLIKYAKFKLKTVIGDINFEDFVSDIICDLLEEKHAWDIIKYKNAYSKVKYHIYWEAMELYGSVKSYQETLIQKTMSNDFSEIKYSSGVENLQRSPFENVSNYDFYKNNQYDTDFADFNIKGEYVKLNDVEFIKHNKNLHIKDWYDNKATPFQKNVIDLKYDGLKDQEIAIKLNVPISKVYNVLKNNKGKFKNLPF